MAKKKKNNVAVDSVIDEKNAVAAENVNNEKNTIEEKSIIVEKSTIDEKNTIDEKSTIAAGKRYGVVSCAILKVREEPSTLAGIKGYIKHNDKVEILADANEIFYQIVGGFVMKKYIDG